MVAQASAETIQPHRHLEVVEGGSETRAPKRTYRRLLAERWLVVSLMLAAIGMYVASLFVSWWEFWLFAPQYPKGLRLHVGLRGMTGDVREIDTINHYIGMHHIADAASFERHWAVWGIGLLGFLVVAFALAPGKRLSGLLMIPALVFPLTFLADSMYWLHSYGHHLDPHAPLHFLPFTPQMFGEGIIGQFRTYAIPSTGFWLACGAIAVLLVAVFERRRVCRHCGRAPNCGALCPKLLVGPGAGRP